MTNPINADVADITKDEANTPDPAHELSHAPEPIAEGADSKGDETVNIADLAEESVNTAVETMIGFDPAIHESNPDGTPRLTKDGSFRRKRGNASRKARVSGPDTDSETDAATETPTTRPAIPGAVPDPKLAALNNKAVAALLVSTCTTVLTKVIGPEWEAGKDEAKNLSGAAAAYLDSIGGVELTPGVALSIAIVGYAAPRLAVQNTQSKLSRLRTWIVDRYHAMRGRIGV